MIFPPGKLGRHGPQVSAVGGYSITAGAPIMQRTYPLIHRNDMNFVIYSVKLANVSADKLKRSSRTSTAYPRTEASLPTSRRLDESASTRRIHILRLNSIQHNLNSKNHHGHRVLDCQWCPVCGMSLLYSAILRNLGSRGM